MSYLVFKVGKRLSREINRVVVFPFEFHIAVQQPFKPLWSHLLLYDHELSRASFALCFISLLPASEESLSHFPSPRHHSSSGCNLLDLSVLEDPTGRIATAGLALRVTGTHKSFHHSILYFNKLRKLESM
jgi:hypothetical protein